MADRAPEFSGTCRPAIRYNVTTASTTTPYTCGVGNATAASAAAAAAGAALTGVECTAAVDRQLDCDALCVCAAAVPNTTDIITGCSAASVPGYAAPGVLYCECPACDEILPATTDPSYEIITGLNANSSRRLQQVPQPIRH